MVIALQQIDTRLSSFRRGMKKGFWKLIIGVILATSSGAGMKAKASPNLSEQGQKKEPVQIVVVDKRDREKSGSSGQSQKPRPADHNRKSKE